MRFLLIYHDWMQVDVLRKYEKWFLLLIIIVLIKSLWACISANPCITSIILFSHSSGIDYHNSSNPKSKSVGIAKNQSRYLIDEWVYENTTVTKHLDMLTHGFEVSSLFQKIVFKTVATNLDYQLNVWKKNNKIKTLHRLMPPIVSYDL